MGHDEEFAWFVRDQLGGLPGLAFRKMFDSFGIYLGRRFFGIVHKGALYFKTDGESREAYADRGMEPFRPSETQTLKNYYEVPVDILEDRDLLRAWAVRAAEAG